MPHPLQPASYTRLPADSQQLSTLAMALGSRLGAHAKHPSTHTNNKQASDTAQSQSFHTTNQLHGSPACHTTAAQGSSSYVPPPRSSQLCCTHMGVPPTHTAVAVVVSGTVKFWTPGAWHPGKGPPGKGVTCPAKTP
jgi:hypothetical protein